MQPKKSKKDAPAAPTANAPLRRGFVPEWTVNIIMLLFGTTTLVQAFVIPTGSMQDTLLIGDHLLVDKLAYAPSGPISKYLLPYEQVKRGDIIVFRSPADLNMTLVKRCMGVPGDRIRLVDKQVYLNGRKLDEPYVRHITEFIDPYRDEFPGVPDMQVTPTGVDMLEHHVIDGEVVVPPDHYFAMGDNRDNSLDSRYWGFVPHDNIVGKPVLVYWSYDAPSEALLNPTVGVDHLIDMTEHFFSKTRWRRTFLLVHGYPVN
ncbi:MAG: signal peptidase I [Bryobacteraceae bacterium]|jgi:signal peptidase I